jgi:hypothetical protein
MGDDAISLASALIEAGRADTVYRDVISDARGRC